MMQDVAGHSQRVKCWLDRWEGRLWTGAIAMVLAIGALLSWFFWEDINDGNDSLSTIIRNLALVIGGTIAVLLAVWRSRISERQATAAQDHAETAQRQAETAQRGLLNERYQRGAEMLGSKVLSVRLGGIYALGRLAEEHPEEYHIQILELFCAFVRFPTKDTNMRSNLEGYGDQDDRTLRADVQDVTKAIGTRSPTGISLELSQKDFKLYLRDANMSGLQLRGGNLSGAWLTNANLSGAILPYTILSCARLRHANLVGVELRHADLSGAKFWGADLTRAVLRDANLSGADLCGADARAPANRSAVRGLTQAQLDEARADSDNPPKLNGVLDAETGAPLIWHEGPRSIVQ